MSRLHWRFCKACREPFFRLTPIQNYCFACIADGRQLTVTDRSNPFTDTDIQKISDRVQRWRDTYSKMFKKPQQILELTQDLWEARLELAEERLKPTGIKMMNGEILTQEEYEYRRKIAEDRTVALNQLNHVKRAKLRFFAAATTTIKSSRDLQSALRKGKDLPTLDSRDPEEDKALDELLNNLDLE